MDNMHFLLKSARAQTTSCTSSGWMAHIFAAVLVLNTVPAVSAAAEQKSDDPHHWGYSGAQGPEHWSELDPQFAACKTGKYETPIDIKQATSADLPALVFDYAATPASVVDNGHTVMVTYAPGSTLTVGDKKYELKQFHFHHPSEEAIHGKHSDMVAHLVHADGDGHLAVVAVLLQPGAANPVLSQIKSKVSTEKGHPLALAERSLDAKDLLPKSLGYYTFPGSLTTPPCTEGVTWYVLKTPVEIAPDQLEWFTRLYPSDARPLQPLHGRAILETKY
jgi:carbonic anhydrase